MSIMATCRVSRSSSDGSHEVVSACRSTTQKMASWASAAGEPAGGWPATHRAIAPHCAIHAEFHDPRHDRARYRAAPVLAWPFAMYHITVIPAG